MGGRLKEQGEFWRLKPGCWNNLQSKVEKPGSSALPGKRQLTWECRVCFEVPQENQHGWPHCPVKTAQKRAVDFPVDDLNGAFLQDGEKLSGQWSVLCFHWWCPPEWPFTMPPAIVQRHPYNPTISLWFFKKKSLHSSFLASVLGCVCDQRPVLLLLPYFSHLASGGDLRRSYG